MSSRIKSLLTGNHEGQLVLNSLALSLLFVGLGTGATNVSYTGLDTSMPTETRLQSFLSQLNILRETLRCVHVPLHPGHSTNNLQLETDGCIGYVSGNETLGIPSICMGDGPEGMGNNLNNVTTFPAPVLITATWDEKLNKQFGEALAQEHRSNGRNVIFAPSIDRYQI